MRAPVATGLAPSAGKWPHSRWTWTRRDTSGSLDPPKHHISLRRNRGIRCWALSCSLAATEEILVSFFSSA